MKRVIAWLADNADVVIGLGLAVFASILGIAGIVPGYVVANVTVLTLATLAFVMLRDRGRQEKAAKQIAGSVTSANAQVLHLFAKFQENRPIKILNGPEISRALVLARTGTDQLVFKGATGTFTRGVSLPECLTAARDSRRPLRVRIEVFDPSDTQLLESYVKLYASWADGPDDPQGHWTVDDTRQEILATILSACWQKEKHPWLLDIEVFLSPALTTFRWDLTHNALIITQIGPRFPAMLIERDDVYYSCWSAELYASMEASARRLPLREVSAVQLGDRPGPAAVRELFDHLNVPIPDTYRDEDLKALIQKALDEDDPYRREPAPAAGS
ncbi:MAG: hypothetical protein ACRDN0_23095 [Trebonia sp.]